MASTSNAENFMKIARIVYQLCDYTDFSKMWLLQFWNHANLEYVLIKNMYRTSRISSTDMAVGLRMKSLCDTYWLLQVGINRRGEEKDDHLKITFCAWYHQGIEAILGLDIGLIHPKYKDIQWTK